MKQNAISTGIPLKLADSTLRKLINSNEVTAKIIRLNVCDLQIHPIYVKYYLPIYEYQELINSKVKQFGLMQFPVVTEDNFIVSGNEIYHAIKNSGLETIDVNGRCYVNS